MEWMERIIQQEIVDFSSNQKVVLGVDISMTEFQAVQLRILNAVTMENPAVI